jgi:hypothetical protein
MKAMMIKRAWQLLPVEGWLAFCVFAFHFVFIAIIQDFGWDDGAITLAFSRTLSESGKIALTPYSEAVEGYSSTLWMVVMSFLHWLLRPGFSEFIRVSQFSAALACSLSAVMFYNLFRQKIDNQILPAFAISILLFVQKPLISESVNGMEMLAAGTLALLLMLLVEEAEKKPAKGKERAYLVALPLVAAVASLIRFEFMFYLLGASLALLLRKSTSLSLLIGLGGAAGFAANAIHRIWYFRDILPNTIHAKRWPPYKDFQLDGIRSILSRIKDGASGGIEIFKANSAFFLLLLALLLFLFILVRPSKWLIVITRRSEGNSSIAFALGFSLAVVIFSFLTGKNWGYESRMQLMAVPLIVLIISFWLKQMSLEVISLVPRSAISAYILWALIFASILHLPVPASVGAGIRYNLLGKDPLSSGEGFGVTPAGYRYTGQSVDRIRESLEMESIKFLVPDVGGLGLGSPRINVLDSALLTSRKLAQSGYDDFPEYFASVEPDVIETHGIWSEVTGIYRLKDFRENYVPITVDANWLYLRKDHYNKLLKKRLLESVACESSCHKYRYRGAIVDEEYVDSMGSSASVKSLPPAWRPAQ